jgi:hypothetical protein
VIVAVVAGLLYLIYSQRRLEAAGIGLRRQPGQPDLVAWGKPGTRGMVACVPLVFRLYSACNPLVLPLPIPGAALTL